MNKPEKQVETYTSGEIVSADEARDHILSFFSVGEVGTAFRASEFEVSEEIERLIDIFRNGKNTDSLRAQKALREIAKEALVTSGVVGTRRLDRSGTDENGNQLHEQVTIHHILTRKPSNPVNTNQIPGITQLPPADRGEAQGDRPDNLGEDRDAGGG